MTTSVSTRWASSDDLPSLRALMARAEKAARVIMGVEQRQLLMAMRDVAGVVDVERDGERGLVIGGHPLVDERIDQADHVAQGRRRVLEPRQRGLRGEIASRVGQAPAGELESRIGAQKVEIVGVLIAAADREDAGADPPTFEDSA
jgi:hypothetical protein